MRGGKCQRPSGKAQDRSARDTRTERTGEVRVVDFDKYVLPTEMRLVLSVYNGCSPEDIKLESGKA